MPERHFKSVCLSGEGSLGMTMPCLHKQGKEAQGLGAWAYQTQLRLDLQGDPAE